MAGIYIHIPFCRQKCHYCDFHFAVSQRQIPDMVTAIAKEIALRKDELTVPIRTLYFGGGTPSMLSKKQLHILFDTLHKHFNLSDLQEVTLEANPDDISVEYLKMLQSTPVNRLSIGVQSFYDDELQWMNRSHKAQQAITSIKMAQDMGFSNLNMDLIYGIPISNTQKWEQNIETFLSLDIPHLSAYALTVEPKTALEHFIQKAKTQPPDEEQALKEFRLLSRKLRQKGYQHYELSNFSLPDKYSNHNTSYWQGKPYLGLGPSAHSYDGKVRSWNVANNAQYLKAIAQNKFPNEIEHLTENQRYNEYLLTGLRTMWGVSLDKIEREFGGKYTEDLLKKIQKHIDLGNVSYKNKTQLLLTEQAWFVMDAILTDLFVG
jgi:oxygen-independent coproporphyrinogen-3 oxidase